MNEICKRCSSEEGFQCDSCDYVEVVAVKKPLEFRTISPMKKENKVKSFKLDIPPLTLNQKTIYLGMAYSSTQQIHDLIKQNKVISSRPFQGMCQQGLQFDSFFESGNLDRVDKIGQSEYNLYMRIDTNSIGHSNWFYFKISNCQLEKIKLNICNFTKDGTLYMKGMKPYVQSAKSEQRYFTQQGEQIQYIQTGENHFTLSFVYQFQYTNDHVSFAALPPYTYTQLMTKIKKWKTSNYVFKTTTGKSLAQLSIPMITIIDKSVHTERKTIIMTSRVHPSETCSSYMIEGVINFLISQSAMATYLRKHFIFKIIPMLNPDGVVVGNYRNGLQGVDINRQFQENDLAIHSEVHALKSLIDSNVNHLFAYFDFHGHQQRKGIFVYGPACVDPKPNGYADAKLIPLILQKKLPSFRMKSCEFGIPKWKAQTARAYANQYLQNLCYTVEASFCGYQENNKLRRFIFKDWLMAGQIIGQAIFLYLQIKKLNKQVSRHSLPKHILDLTIQDEPAHQSDNERNEQTDFEQDEDYNDEGLTRLKTQFKKQMSRTCIQQQQTTIEFKSQTVQLIKKPMIQVKLQLKYSIYQIREVKQSTLQYREIKPWLHEFGIKTEKVSNRARTNSLTIQSIKKDRMRQLSQRQSPQVSPDIQRVTVYNFPTMISERMTPLPKITQSHRYQKIYSQQ